MKLPLIPACALLGFIACSEKGPQAFPSGQSEKGKQNAAEAVIAKHEHAADELKKVTPPSVELGSGRDTIDLMSSDLFCFVREKESALTIKFARRGAGRTTCSEIAFSAMVPAAGVKDAAKHRVIYYLCESTQENGKLGLHRKLLRSNGEMAEDKLLCASLYKLALAYSLNGKDYKQIERDIRFPSADSVNPHFLQLDLHVFVGEGAVPKLIRTAAEVPQ